MKSSIHLDSQEEQQRLNKKLAAYFASAGFVGAITASSDANAAIVGSGPISIQFGPANGGPGNINIPIDLDTDGETDFELKHVTNSAAEDYLEIDKSPNDSTNNFPDNNLDGADNDWNYLVQNLGDYPQSLAKGASGGTQFAPPAGLQYEFWVDSSNYLGGGTTRRANRLIDHDSGVDEANWNPPPNGAQFLGQQGVDQYLPFYINRDGLGPKTHGWIGVNITDDATASGELIGYALQTVPQRAILMGDFIPEPATLGLVALGGVTLAGSWISRKLWR